MGMLLSSRHMNMRSLIESVTSRTVIAWGKARYHVNEGWYYIYVVHDVVVGERDTTCTDSLGKAESITEMVLMGSESVCEDLSVMLAWMLMLLI